MPPSDRDPATGMPMRDKVRTYILGVAIGLVLLGMMLMSRWNRQAQQQQADPAGGQQAAQPTPIPPGAGLPTGPR